MAAARQFSSLECTHQLGAATAPASLLFMSSAKQRKKGTALKEPLTKKGGPKGKERSGPLGGVLLGAAVVGAVGVGLWYARLLGPASSEGGADAGGGGEFSQGRCGPADREHFSEMPARGLHILTLPSGGEGGTCASGDSLQTSLHVDGWKAEGPAGLEVPCSGAGIVDTVRNAVAGRRMPQLESIKRNGFISQSAYQELAHRDGVNRWAFYTPGGSPITATEVAPALETCGVVYAYEGGNFVWPGVRIGYNITLKTGDEEFGDVTLTTLSLQPLVFTMDPLLTKKECKYIIKKATPEMEVSPVSHIDSDIGKPDSQWRTSTQARLPKGGGKVVSKIERRAHALLNVPESHGEPLQVLRYEVGQKYDAHHDYFDPELYAGQPHMLEMVEGGKRNRLATLLWYMQEPSGGGGETHFPRAGGLPVPHSFLCGENDSGIKVKPKQGKATLFYSLRPDGAPDPFSLHGGCPPIGDGRKWAVNKWVWSKTY